MSDDPADQSDKYRSLADRFDERARRLRRQASFLLAMIIGVLFAGAAGFIFANYIANLNPYPHTAAAQYEVAVAALKQTREQVEQVQKQLNDIFDVSSISKPFNDSLANVKEKLSSLEDIILQKCQSITRQDRFSNISMRDVRSMVLLTDVNAENDRIGEFSFTTPDRKIFFANHDAATDCRAKKITQVEYDEIKDIIWRFEDITRERGEALENLYKARRRRQNH